MPLLQGAILSGELLDAIARQPDELPGQRARDFGFDDRNPLRERIGQAWSVLKLQWQIFQQKRAAEDPADPLTSLTRDRWVMPLLTELGYEPERAAAEEVNGRSFAISHRDRRLHSFPLLVMGAGQHLDRKPATLRLSPHALLQGYLNETEHLYGLLTNGRQVRLLRQSGQLVRLSFIEFDLEQIFEEGLYADFALLYRLLHASRMPQAPEQAPASLLEDYHQRSLDAGARIREQLSRAMKEAMETLANGFLSQPGNAPHAAALRTDPAALYRLLLRTMYRLIFLAVTEARDLVFDPAMEPARRQHFRSLYYRHYALDRLRALAERADHMDPRAADRWPGLLDTFSLFEPGPYGPVIGIEPLGGDLFAQNGLADHQAGIDLTRLSLDNRTLLSVIDRISRFVDARGALVRINYRDLDVEELGSVYESLLELHPYTDAGGHFAFREGAERKTTGSYYTRHDLVRQLVGSALLPVLDARLRAAGWDRQRLSGDAARAEQALLALKVCDPAAGSGHFLLEAARTLGYELARIRAREDNPGDETVQQATRDVIARCLYAVDKNPAAVELCKLALWLTGHNGGKALSFLDHKVACGDSLVGIDTLDRLREGIPDGAYNALSQDDKSAASAAKKANKAAREGQLDLFRQSAWEQRTRSLLDEYRDFAGGDSRSAEGYEARRRTYERMTKGNDWMQLRTACNLFTYAFFQPYDEEARLRAVNTHTLRACLESMSGSADARLEGKAHAAAVRYGFFHWPLAFPDVFLDDGQRGFDVLLGNPPWERIKLQEKEFFGAKDPEIATASNKAEREKLIKTLPQRKPELAQAFREALHEAESSSRFIRESQRFALTGRGDVNTYSVFSEHLLNLLHSQGRAGIIVPTGIATDDTNKHFFAHLVEQGRLLSLFDFENRKKLFPAVDSRQKFSLVTLGSAAGEMRFGFFLLDVSELQDPRRVFALTSEDFRLINPNTRTCPIFRTREDATLTRAIYRRVPVLLNEDLGQNPWGIKFSTMFHMSNDSHLFRTAEQLAAEGWERVGNRWVKGEEDGRVVGTEGVGPAVGTGRDLSLQQDLSQQTGLSPRPRMLPLYEAKMIWHYDHRFASFDGADARGDTRSLSPEEQQDPAALAQPWYWVPEEEVARKADGRKWFVGFRDIARSTDERTAIFSLLGWGGVNHKMPLVFLGKNITESILAYGCTSSLIFDFVVRQKIGGTSLTFFYVKQLPLLAPETYTAADRAFLLPRILELSYTAWDLKGFADELWAACDADLRALLRAQQAENLRETGAAAPHLPPWRGAYPEIDWEGGCPLQPFRWDEGRRASLRAELDAYYSLLYGLDREELRYILDPQEVHGEDFPGESFRVLKDKDIRRYGHYRTRDLVLAAYDALAPAFDLPAQIRRLEDIWRKYQQPTATAKIADPALAAPPAQKKSKPAPPPQKTALFEVAAPVKSQGKRVVARDPQGREHRFFICKDATPGQFTTDGYQEVSEKSALGVLLVAFMPGQKFRFGKGEWEVLG
ncbi:MAG: hypothetical protein NW241_00335 [Bacteroidia bacterium]|nr:hypothetical protein [Bacteroidia bacterium]